MDLRQLSRASGLSYEGIRNYVRVGSGRVPSAPNGIALARALGVTAEWLFDDSRDWPPVEPSTPPFRIRPWPPDTVNWIDVQTAITLFLAEKWQDAWSRIGAYTHFGEPIPPELEQTASDALHLTQELGAIYIDKRKETEPSRRLLCEHYNLDTRFEALIRGGLSFKKPRSHKPRPKGK